MHLKVTAVTKQEMVLLCFAEPPPRDEAAARPSRRLALPVSCVYCCCHCCSGQLAGLQGLSATSPLLAAGLRHPECPLRACMEDRCKQAVSGQRVTPGLTPHLAEELVSSPRRPAQGARHDCMHKHHPHYCACVLTVCGGAAAHAFVCLLRGVLLQSTPAVTELEQWCGCSAAAAVQQGATLN